ncbi:unnamed protein product [Trifolium pratense]|uniref:Uncharacterized protein n=1 Tax=Trifolium pratense TaxID=57577 RepID=A0ACB0KAC9_TRIPR|nr:unnamed protein product [Trifolium pratense]
MKKYLLQRGLRPGSDFAKAVGIEKPPTWDDLLLKAQKYIDYEEVQAADVARLARPGSSHPARESSHRNDDRGGDKGSDRGGDRGGERGRDRRRGERREPRGPPSTFATYTPLVKSRGEIFAEVHISEFDRANVATLHGDIEAARRCFDAASKGNNFIGKAPEAKKPKPSSETPPKPSPEAPPSLPGPSVSSVDLDSRTSKKEHKEEKKLRKEEKEDDEASKEHYRPIPDGDFEIVQFGEDPEKGVKIGRAERLPDEDDL